MKSQRTLPIAILGCVLIFILGGCATVSYDQNADSQITSLTQEIDLQLITWASQAAQDPSKVTYDSKFYDKAEADTLALQIRMEATQDPATDKIAEIFKSINTQLENLRNLHKKQNKLDEPFLRAELALLNVQLATLTTFELSLKGTSSGTSTAKTTSTSTANAQGKASQLNANQIVENAMKQ